MKNMPRNHLPSWHNVSWVIYKGVDYCSNVYTLNLYLRKLFWKTANTEAPKFLQVKNLFTQWRQEKNKEQNSPMQQGQMKDILSTQHHIGDETTGRLHTGKAEDLDQGSSVYEAVWSHSGGTGTTQIATVILQVPKSCRKHGNCAELKSSELKPRAALRRLRRAWCSRQSKSKADMLYDPWVHRTDGSTGCHCTLAEPGVAVCFHYENANTQVT